MHTVSVHQVAFSEQQVAHAIAAALGDGYECSPDGPRTVSVKRGFFARAKVSWHEDGDDTVFEVHGQGPPFPLGYLALRLVNYGRVARRIAAAIPAGLAHGS
jgi:hypothetical protein